MNPKVSLILTTYNSKLLFMETMKSISTQDYDNIEIIVKDGGSTDGTIDVLSEFEKSFKYPVIWESSKDSGIYDAMNQGFRCSTGDVIAFFNDKYTQSIT